MQSDADNPASQDNWVVVEPNLFDYPVPKGQKPALYANRCQACQGVYFPKRDTCPKCFSNGKLVNQSISGRGTIYAATVVHIPSPSGIRPPYAYGYVDMNIGDGNSQLRLFAHFTEADPQRLSVGQAVELSIGEIRRDDQGRAVIAHVFQPVDQE